jgi:hypothetical protein
LPQLLDLEKGVDIARQHNYPNPPIMAVLLEPLAKLPPLAAALVWFYLKVGFTLLALFWIFRLVEDLDRPFPPWACAVVGMLSLKPIVDDLNHGNVNLFILFLVVGALTAYRKRRDLLAGAVLGLAIACKVTPALFVPYFLWKRSWRVLAGVVLGLGLFLYPGMVPSLRLGYSGNQQFLASWYGVMVHPFLVEGKVTSEHHNQSLPGVVARLATHKPSFTVWEHRAINVPTRFDNFVSLSDAQARWLVKGCMGLFALLVVWCCRTPTSPRQGWRLAAEYSLVVLGMLLFSERTWKHHCVTLALPFAVLCYHIAVCRPPARLRAYLLGSLVVVALLMAVPGLSAGKEDGHAVTAASPGLAKLAEVYGAYTLACLVLLAALAVLLRTQAVPAAEGQACAPPAPERRVA